VFFLTSISTQSTKEYCNGKMGIPQSNWSCFR